MAANFPGPPTNGMPASTREKWQLSREWSGYPELEWTFGIFRERIEALSGRVPAYFYEDVEDFNTTRYLLRVQTFRLRAKDPAAPSVGVAFEYFDSAYRVADGRLQSDGSPFRGRHAVVAVDHEDEDEIRFINTWNPPYWGDGGFGYITRNYFDRHVDSVFARWSAAGGPSPPAKKCMEDAKNHHLEFLRRMISCWPTRNVYWRQPVEANGVQFILLNWEVYSVATGSLVNVLEIRDEEEVIGRAHLCYDADDIPTLRELFVRPTRRGEGIGSLLEGTAALWAQQDGFDGMKIWLREADARPRIIGAPLAFASARGYEWEDVAMRRPNIVKFARRGLI